jgi:peptidylprolyl isomerase
MKFSKALLLLTISSMSLWAKAKPMEESVKQESKEAAQEVDVKKLSVAIGHLISKTINDIGIAFDIDLVIQGLKDASNGIASPLTEADCVSAITQEQKKAFDALAAKNLKEAEQFLAVESKKKDIKSIENGKVIYKVIQEGKGDIVHADSKVSIRYKGSLLNGEVFGESQQDETLDMNHLVSGLKQAMVGMKEGEKRLIHIHPEKGYGTEGMLPPNSLLSFEIQVTKAKIDEVAQTHDESVKQELETESNIR